MNVLLIAPHSDLPYAAEEVRAISLILRPVILEGVVRRSDVLNTIRSHDWDIIWFISHGDSSGIELSDEKIPISDLTSVVRASGAWLVVLNTCSSRLIGLELFYELNVCVITTVSEVDDQTTYQTGVLLARALAETKDPIQAFEFSKPGQNSDYLIFYQKDRSDAVEVRTILSLNEWGSRLSKKIEDLENQFNKDLRDFRQDLLALSKHSVHLPPWSRFAFFAGFSFLLLPVPLFFEEVRDLLGISWQSSLFLSILSYVIGSILWSYLWWGGEYRK